VSGDRKENRSLERKRFLPLFDDFKHAVPFVGDGPPAVTLRRRGRFSLSGTGRGSLGSGLHLPLRVREDGKAAAA
jgi:hypothetical protein